MKMIEILDSITDKQVSKSITRNKIETFNEEEFFKVFMDILNDYDIATSISKHTLVKHDKSGTYNVCVLTFKDDNEQITVDYDESIFTRNIFDKVGISGNLLNCIFKGILNEQIKMLNAKRYMLKKLLPSNYHELTRYFKPHYIEDLLGIIKQTQTEEVYKIAVKISEMEF